MKLLVLISLVAFQLEMKAQSLQPLQEELTAIFEQSLSLRRSVMPTIKRFGFNSHAMDSLNKTIIAFDSISLCRAVEIIEKYGWLGISEVGESANQALFLTVQHALDKSVRAKYFVLLEESAKKGESHMSDMATMKDRMLIENGGRQLYGTQYKIVAGKIIYLPLDDSIRVNERRMAIGMENIEWQ